MNGTGSQSEVSGIGGGARRGTGALEKRGMKGKHIRVRVQTQKQNSHKIMWP